MSEFTALAISVNGLNSGIPADAWIIGFITAVIVFYGFLKIMSK